MARKKNKKRSTKLILPPLPKGNLQDIVQECKWEGKNLAIWNNKDKLIYCAASFKAICVYQDANYFTDTNLYICKKYNNRYHKKQKS